MNRFCKLFWKFIIDFVFLRFNKFDRRRIKNRYNLTSAQIQLFLLFTLVNWNYIIYNI